MSKILGDDISTQSSDVCMADLMILGSEDSSNISEPTDILGDTLETQVASTFSARSGSDSGSSCSYDTCSCNSGYCPYDCGCNTYCNRDCSCDSYPKCSPDVTVCSCDANPCQCDSLPCSCNSKPCTCDSEPCSCDTAPCSCNTAPCSCNSDPCSCDRSGPCQCDSLPCYCNAYPCYCNSEPCSCDSDPCSCDTAPCSCNTAPCACNYSGPCSCNTAPCACNSEPCSCDSEPCSCNSYPYCYSNYRYGSTSNGNKIASKEAVNAIYTKKFTDSNLKKIPTKSEILAKSGTKVKGTYSNNQGVKIKDIGILCLRD